MLIEKKNFSIINRKVEYDLKKLINVTRRFFQKKKKCYKIMYLLTATIWQATNTFSPITTTKEPGPQHMKLISCTNNFKILVVPQISLVCQCPSYSKGLILKLKGEQFPEKSCKKQQHEDCITVMMWISEIVKERGGGGVLELRDDQWNNHNSKLILQRFPPHQPKNFLTQK